MSALQGDKIIINNGNNIGNMGAIFLYPNQKDYYLNYFLLLLSFWDYIKTNKQINEIRIFIKKYYKNSLYLLIFETALNNNKNYVYKTKNIYMINDFIYYNKKHIYNFY